MNAITRRKTLHTARRPSRSPLPWWLVWLLAGLVGVFGLVALGIGALFALYSSYTGDYVPIEAKITTRYVGFTQVFDRGGPDGGTYLGALSNENGPIVQPVNLPQISQFLIDATISTEDNNFWTNKGIDPKGIVRAAVDNYTGGGIGSGTGGSTLTQQLVKNVYLTDDCTFVNGVQSCIAPRTLDRKLKEIAYAVQVEKNYSKEQILNWYLNQVSYGDRYVGIEAASQGYFRKPAAQLDLAEAALLAGVPAAPTAYHPRTNCLKAPGATDCLLDDQGRTTIGGAAKERQDYVLNLMVKHHRITQAEADAALAEVIKVYPAQNPIRASAWIDDQVEPRLVRMCEAGILPQLPGTTDCTQSVHTAGYKVTSTMDYGETQKALQMAAQYVANGLKAGCQCHNASIVTIEPTTGQVLVYVPNVDPNNTADPRVSGTIDQAVEVNQPGSSFKPAVYLTYFDKLQKTPMSSLWDTSPMTISDPGAPTTAVIVNPRPGGGGEGLITARAAMGGSQNVGAFRAAEEAGIDNVIDEAKALGITTLDQGFDPTFYDHSSIYYGPSIATGGANIRAIDMAYMNATLANMGTMVGVPTLAQTVPLDQMLSISTTTGDEQAKAYQQKLDFTHGNIRLPGTRTLDPVTVLQVRANDGTLLYQEGDDLQHKQVVDPGNVWQVYSIMSDCTARFIIWGCGSSNNDNNLDAFMPDGTKIPMGIKTGTQQGFVNANETLATWMNGFTRYAATAVWVGNADKSLVNNAAFAAADYTQYLFKNWMSQYHADLQAEGVFKEPAGFADLQPSDVVYGKFQSATTERGMAGGCGQVVMTWMLTTVQYKGDCQGLGYMPLPPYQQADAAHLAASRGIRTGPPTPRPAAATSAQQDAATPTPAPSPTAKPTTRPGRR